MTSLIEMLKEDVNQEDGFTLTFFTKLVSFLFKGVILFAIPTWLYILFFIWSF
jgi:hypothetical protein